jgi:hypothetical protein
MRTTVTLAIVLVLAAAGAAFGAWPPVPGQTGTITVNSPNSQNGAEASVWGFYTGSSGWANTTFGTGTFSGGSATVNYTVPADFVSDFYWNITAKYSASHDERGQYEDTAGSWGQFLTNDPNGQTVSVSVYQFDQRKVTTTTASFRASGQSGTVFPPAALTTGWVTVRRPWTGTMAQYTNASGTETDSYYTNAKTSLLPTRLASQGYSVEVLEGDPGATQQFQKIRLHNADDTYSVELFGYKNLTSDDPAGYLWWTTLVDVGEADCVYNGTTGVFSGSFATPLPTGVMYFVAPEFVVLDAVGSTKDSWVQAGRGTDLLLSGSSFKPNLLSLDPTLASLYVKSGESVVVEMNVANLQQKVNACQAMLGYASTYLTAAAGCVAPGGGVWDQLIWNSWDIAGIPGEIDTAIGVNAQGAVGTEGDATVAVITLTAGSTEATTTIVFRPDVSDVEGTFLSDMAGQAVLPTKQDSMNIIIDNTAPVITRPADYATSTATVTIAASAADVRAGMDTFTMNSGAFSGSATVVLVPGANTFTFVGTDKAGNSSTDTLTITYNQPAPAATVLTSIAPNAFGSPSYTQWLENAFTAATQELSSVGSGYSKFEVLSGSQDHASVIVSSFNSWKGLLSVDPEFGNRTHFVGRIYNGVKENPGAAKLDAGKVSKEGVRRWEGSDTDADDLNQTWGQTPAAPSFDFSAGVNLRGYNWDGTQWVRVTTGRFADLLAWNSGAGSEPDSGTPPTQATLDGLYKRLTGSVAWTDSGLRRALSWVDMTFQYTDGVTIPSATGTQKVNLASKDTTAPVITITAPADGVKVNAAAQTITGTVTDNETLASGVREVKITLNSVEVYSNTAQDNVSFSQAVTLAEGSNTITVDAKDFAGNTQTRTITVILDTSAPTISIDSAVQGSELLISLGSTVNAVEGAVTITVSAGDGSPSSGLVTPPVVTVTPAGGSPETLTGSGSGPWTYTYTVLSTTANGVATITVTVPDEAGNSSSDTDTFNINKHEITGQVELQGFVGSSRAVTFVATDAGGNALKTWSPTTLSFASATANFRLTDVPAGTRNLSAKTAWSLRRGLPVSYTDDRAQVNFTGTSKVAGGDLNNTNSVNILDYSVMKTSWGSGLAGDINGDGFTGTLDYQIMTSNWFKAGDPQ